ncbi:hypothetical protein [Stenotrophomonas nematodicola]|uniref:hypothetical protein n=1 Tax=Stenotrophomonas nematodicola TaxID=2656746 RepID=UPI0012922101|nr:hypothetical protein [Stenotrophomonas nematodicola]
MAKVRALSSFEHGGHRSRGHKFEVSPQHADLLVKRGLVALIPGSLSASVGGAPLARTGAALVGQNASDVIAELATVVDMGTLAAALEAEQSKGDKARKTVLEAIASAIAALPKE